MFISEELDATIRSEHPAKSINEFYREASDNPLVYVVMRYHANGVLTFEQALVKAVILLSRQNRELTQKLMDELGYEARPILSIPLRGEKKKD
jgi:hypothetical protein